MRNSPCSSRRPISSQRPRPGDDVATDRSTPPPDDRWDDALLAAGFDVDPDHQVSGPASAEPVDESMDDPWRELRVDAVGLSDDQRAWIDDTSPALAGSLPPQTLTGHDPLGDVSDAAVESADDDVIPFD